MAGFLYYLPGEGGQSYTAAELAAAGLSNCFEQNPDCAQVIRGGPDGGPGRVLVEPATVPRIGVFLEAQSWRMLPGGTWLGWYTEEPPRPEDLQRREQLPGHEVELGDGRRWLVPVARRMVEQAGQLLPTLALPCRYGYDPASGQWLRDRPVPRYAELWTLAERWWDCWIEAIRASGDEDGADEAPRAVTFNLQDQLNTALVALAANYRLGPHEATVLGLLDDTSAVAVLQALVDWPSVDAFRKKKRPGG